MNLRDLSASVSSLVITLLSLSVAQPNAAEPSAGESKKPTPDQAGSRATATKQVREPAVAGLFYPKDSAELSRIIDRLLESAEVEPVSDLRALVCPHAGYEFSGLTAAHGYRLAAGRRYRTVVVLAPSHYAAFSGACVSGADLVRTPLGSLRVGELARSLRDLRPFVAEAPCPLERPTWWTRSSRQPPANEADTPDTWEHSDEVQMPFLQKVLPSCEVVPVVMGRVETQRAATVLAERIDDRTLVIASSDLSHYHPYAEAQKLDRACVKAICTLDIETMQSQEACGKTPILTVMHLARQEGWRARLLDYRNSGDTAGDKAAVVGYAAIAFYAPGKEKFAASDRKLMLQLARATLEQATGATPTQPIATEPLAKRFPDPKGCFVTLRKQGALRGCIGHIFPVVGLGPAIMENAHAAALNDPRFRPVTRDELKGIEIEISVLTEPQPLKFDSPADLVQKLRPHQDGVVLEIGQRRATYLPQVWAQIPNAEEFLNNLAEKAGCPPSAWRERGVTVRVYQVESFKESD